MMIMVDGSSRHFVREVGGGRGVQHSREIICFSVLFLSGPLLSLIQHHFAVEPDATLPVHPPRTSVGTNHMIMINHQCPVSLEMLVKLITVAESWGSVSFERYSRRVVGT